MKLGIDGNNLKMKFYLNNFQEEFDSMFRQGNAPPPASKKFVNSLDDVQLVNDEGVHSF